MGLRLTGSFRQFWEKPVGALLPSLRPSSLNSFPQGPHPVAMFEVNVFDPHQTGALFSWLAVNRGPCSCVRLSSALTRSQQRLQCSDPSQYRRCVGRPHGACDVDGRALPAHSRFPAPRRGIVASLYALKQVVPYNASLACGLSAAEQRQPRFDVLARCGALAANRVAAPGPAPEQGVTVTSGACPDPGLSPKLRSLHAIVSSDRPVRGYSTVGTLVFTMGSPRPHAKGKPASAAGLSQAHTAYHSKLLP